MELNEFISKTITEIMKGVRESQGNAKKLGGKVNPTSMSSVDTIQGRQDFFMTNYQRNMVNLLNLISLLHLLKMTKKMKV